MQNFTISQIEALTESEVKAMAIEVTNIKGHDVYFADLGDTFGYSALVFLNGGHVYYANDYQLHHRHKTRDELRAWYVETLNMILFTEAEICGPIADYDEAERKAYYIRNYFPMQKPYVSCFHIFTGEKGKKEKAEYERKTARMIFSPVFMSYFDPADKPLVNKGAELMTALKRSIKALADSYDYWKGAFKHEMFNHEYGYSEDDFAVLSAFGPLAYDGDDYFTQLGFSDMQRTAYGDARREVLKSFEAC